MEKITLGLILVGFSGLFYYLKLLKAALNGLAEFAIQESDCSQAESQTVPLLPPLPAQPLPSLSVIIPAYNEAENIQACVLSVLESSELPAPQLEVWVVDDQSSDETLAILQTLQQQLGDPRLRILAGAPRPQGETWMGKNWACAQVAPLTKGDYLLFIDADVRLDRGGLEKTLAFAVSQQTDLLTCWVRLICDCWAEWLVQPVIALMFAVAFDAGSVNDPQNPKAFGVGPFMLFRRSAYEQVGGHRAIAAVIVEDVELARRTKQSGLKLWLATAHDCGSLRMYRSFGALWEGWTKNWYLGTQCNPWVNLYSAVSIFAVFAAPWLVAGLAIVQFLIVPNQIGYGINFLLALGLLGIQYYIRYLAEIKMQLSARYWWWMGLGGLITTLIPFVSWFKTETGWGWTWRGRSLVR
ncbi:MAG: glycosyltransferase family 2 protein [Synechococcales bacterium]|nr:glycosyltransferase family 2 protein [Synechococcales bacterium]